MSCLSEKEWILYVDEQLTTDRAREAEHHLETCAGCKQKLAGLRKLASTIAASAVHDDGSSFITSTLFAMDRSHGQTTKWWKYAAAAAVILIALPVSYRIIANRSDNRGTFIARGGSNSSMLQKLTGVETFLVSNGKQLPLRNGITLTREPKLAFRTTNATQNPLYLLAFGIDSQGEIHWFFPAFNDPKTNPKAIALPARTQNRMLQELVQPEGCSQGLMRIVTVISPARRSVDQIETLLKGLSASANLTDIFAHDNVQEWHVTVEVSK